MTWHRQEENKSDELRRAIIYSFKNKNVVKNLVPFSFITVISGIA